MKNHSGGGVSGPRKISILDNNGELLYNIETDSDLKGILIEDFLRNDSSQIITVLDDGEIVVFNLNGFIIWEKRPYEFIYNYFVPFILSEDINADNNKELIFGGYWSISTWEDMSDSWLNLYSSAEEDAEKYLCDFWGRLCVFSSDGKIIWNTQLPVSKGLSPYSQGRVSDLNGDELMEIIVTTPELQGLVFDHEGNLLWQKEDWTRDIETGDFNSDGKSEVFVAFRGDIYGFDDLGNMFWHDEIYGADKGDSIMSIFIEDIDCNGTDEVMCYDINTFFYVWSWSPSIEQFLENITKLLSLLLIGTSLLCITFILRNHEKPEINKSFVSIFFSVVAILVSATDLENIGNITSLFFSGLSLFFFFQVLNIEKLLFVEAEGVLNEKLSLFCVFLFFFSGLVTFYISHFFSPYPGWDSDRSLFNEFIPLFFLFLILIATIGKLSEFLNDYKEKLRKSMQKPFEIYMNSIILFSFFLGLGGGKILEYLVMLLSVIALMKALKKIDFPKSVLLQIPGTYYRERARVKKSIWISIADIEGNPAKATCFYLLVYFCGITLMLNLSFVSIDNPLQIMYLLSIIFIVLASILFLKQMLLAKSYFSIVLLCIAGMSILSVLSPNNVPFFSELFLGAGLDYFVNIQRFTLSISIHLLLPLFCFIKAKKTSECSKEKSFSESRYETYEFLGSAIFIYPFLSVILIELLL